jgi:hypothetical protein
MDPCLYVYFFPEKQKHIGSPHATASLVFPNTSPPPLHWHLIAIFIPMKQKALAGVTYSNHYKLFSGRRRFNNLFWPGFYVSMFNTASSSTP